MVLLGLTRFNQVLLASTRFYWAFTGRLAANNEFSDGFYWAYWVLLGYTWINQVLLSLTVFLGFTRFYWFLLRFTAFYWVLLASTGFYWVLTRFY